MSVHGGTVLFSLLDSTSRNKEPKSREKREYLRKRGAKMIQLEQTFPHLIRLKGDNNERTRHKLGING